MALKTASVLAFERKIANSDAVMFSGQWENVCLENINQNKKANTLWEPIAIVEKSVRGTISNRLKNATANDPAKLDAEVQNPNLQRVDSAALPVGSDTLRVSFTLRVLGNLATPSACNNSDYQTKLQEKIKGYTEQYQFKELARRYAENIANGRFLWRNRMGAKAIKIYVRTDNGDNANTSAVEFNALDFDLRRFSVKPNNDLEKISEVIRQGLAGEKFALLQIDAFVQLGNAQEVFPSQELILDKSDKDKKSKVLYQLKNQAAMHSQKIGNALRTIDTWYDEADTWGAIAVEPYGSVTNRGVAYRQPKDKKDFYTLLDSWVLKDKELTEDELHYVIAILIRGGVFGDAGKE